MRFLLQFGQIKLIDLTVLGLDQPPTAKPEGDQVTVIHHYIDDQEYDDDDPSDDELKRRLRGEED